MIEPYLEKCQTKFKLFCGYMQLIGDYKADQCEELMRDFVYSRTHDCLIEGMQELQVFLDSFRNGKKVYIKIFNASIGMKMAMVYQ